MDNTIDIRKEILKEITDIPEEFIPFIFEQIKALKKSLRTKSAKKNSPCRRLLKLAGSLDNPQNLSAKEYKKQVVNEYLSNRLISQCT